MRGLTALIAAGVLSNSLALQTGMTRRKHKLRPREHRARQLKHDEYRLMRAPKFINGIKKTRIGSRMVDREGITVNVGEDGTIGVNVNVTVDVGVSINTGGGSIENGSGEESEELECIEWNITYVPASSKSSKSKSGKSSKSESKSGKSSKSESKSGKSSKSSKSGDSDDDMIPIEECVAYATMVPSISPSMEPDPIMTASPTETQEIITPSPVAAPVPRPTPIPTLMNITPDPVGDTPNPTLGDTPNPTLEPITDAPVSAAPTDAPDSPPPTLAPVTVPVASTEPPQTAPLPTLPPQSGALPTLPPQTGALPTLPPQSGVLPTLPPQSAQLPTLPPQSGVLPTLPPQSGSVPTNPPQTDSLPTLPPQSGTLPTLPPQTGGLPTLPPQSGTLPTLPPVANIGELAWDFDDGVFPVAPWTTEGDGVWEIDQTNVADGSVYSIKSPDLETDYVDGSGTLVSNATLTLGDNFEGGVLRFQALASVQPPLDLFVVYIDGEDAAQLVNTQEFTEVALGLSVGPHTINFSYQFNPVNLPVLSPSPSERLGAAWIDSVTIDPLDSPPETAPPQTASLPTLPPQSGALPTLPPQSGALPTLPPQTGGLPTLPPQSGALPTLPPQSGALPTLPPQSGGLPTMPPQSGALPTLPPQSGALPTLPPQSGGLPTLPPQSGALPTLPPQSGGLPTLPPQAGALPTLPPQSNSLPEGNSTSLIPQNAIFFDGFETGDLNAQNWSITGESGWAVDETRPYEGVYSAHIKTSDIPNSGEFSSLDLTMTLDDVSFVDFEFLAPVAMPFESFELYVDGTFVTPLATTDSNWTGAGVIVPSGEHVVSWRYANNPGNATDDMLSNTPEPPYRLREAWLDNVMLLPSTQDFVEDFESQSFSTNNWVLSGDADWTITDSNAQDGSYSATASSANITENVGSAILSLDIITEEGGKFGYSILPSVEDPFDNVVVYLDDDIIQTYSNIEPDWTTNEIDIQPGKRTVMFELQKNPGSLSEAELPAEPDGYLGQVWLDAITFTVNAPESKRYSNETESMSPSPTTTEFTELSWDFEEGLFPTPQWSTAGDGVWEIDQTQSDEGNYSIKSPELETGSSDLPLSSNATLTIDDEEFSGGVLKFRAYASVQPPRDIFAVYIDNEIAGQFVDTQGWTDVMLGLSPGPHVIDLSYQYNMFAVSPLPPSPPGRLGAVWVDNIVIESLPAAERAIETSDIPSHPPSESPSTAEGTSSYIPTMSPVIVLRPTISPSYVPTNDPVSEPNNSTSPTGAPTYYPSYAPTYVPSAGE